VLLPLSSSDSNQSGRLLNQADAAGGREPSRSVKDLVPAESPIATSTSAQQVERTDVGRKNSTF
jgi:hypothetical protein